MRQLTLIETSTQPDLVQLAHGTIRRRRLACVERYGKGIRMVDHPRRLHLQLYRGRTLLAQALRPVQDAKAPGIVEKLAWLHRAARAWHTLAMAPDQDGKALRLSAAELEARCQDQVLFEPRWPRAKQLRLLEVA